jgi:hypothetical protein
MKTPARRVAVLAGLALTVASVGLAPSAVANPPGEANRPSKPRTVPVRGQQIPTDSLTKWVMEGDLVGEWVAYPRTPPLHNTKTLYSEAGVEMFSGCIDRNGDGKCGKRDHRGEMYAVYLYWASFDFEGNLIKGQCVHPITGGTGDFVGARGVINMVDTPVGDKVITKYRGDVVLNAVPSEGPSPRPETTVSSTSAKGSSDASRIGC